MHRVSNTLFRYPLVSPDAILAHMAKSWKDAKECAERDHLPQVFHDCDEDVYGACGMGEPQGSFRGGVFYEHRCICMPAQLSPEELAAKEKKFREENPDW